MPSQARIYAILARDTPLAVVFRRGPSKKVLLSTWNTATDAIECGQWLKGRIYERRCDLSPKGDLLLYFAASFRQPYYSWTAISRPPFLTALALWPKGDCWGGGGHFLNDDQIGLNHRDGDLALAADFSLPKWLTVKQLGRYPGRGEDDPVWCDRLARDGWKQVGFPTKTKDDFGKKVLYEFDPPIRWRKPNPLWPRRYSLEMSIIGLDERDGPWYITEHSVIRNEKQSDKIGRSDWADWSHSGDLLFAMDGCLYRVPCKDATLDPLEDAVKVADLSKLSFEARKSPPRARVWPRR